MRQSGAGMDGRPDRRRRMARAYGANGPMIEVSGLAQPFTDPSMKPFMKYFCTKG